MIPQNRPYRPRWASMPWLVLLGGPDGGASFAHRHHDGVSARTARAGIVTMPELRRIGGGCALSTSTRARRREIVENIGSVARSPVCLRSSAEVQGRGS